MGINVYSLKSGCDIWSELNDRRPDNICVEPGFHIETNEARTWVGFCYDQKLLWEIDVNYFSSIENTEAILEIDINENAISNISLVNAYFPGTKLRADFELIVDNTIPTAASMELYFQDKQSNFVLYHIKTKLLDWLHGTNNPIYSLKVPTDMKIVTLAGEDKGWVKLLKDSRISVKFFPNWRFEFLTDNNPFRIDVNYDYDESEAGGERQFVVDGNLMYLTILRAEHPSMSNEPAHKRSLFEIPKNSNNWSKKRLFPSQIQFPINDSSFVPNIDFAYIESDDDIFDVMYIEVGIYNTSIPKRQEILLACGRPINVRSNILDFNPKRFSNLEGVSFLKNELYSIHFEKSILAIDYVNNESGLVLGFAKNPKWFYVDDFAFHLSDTSEDSTLVIINKKKDIDWFQMSFLVDGFMGDLQQGISATCDLSETKEFTVTGVRTKPNQIFDSHDFKPTGIYLEFDVPMISLFREEDLLDIDIEFSNLKIVKKISEAAYLLKSLDSDQSCISIIMKTQHIAESTFNTSDSSNIETPVEAFAAGSSKLGFKIPDDLVSGTESSFVLTGERLMKWYDLESILIPAIESSNFPSEGEPPKENETFIECPWRLYLSPTKNETWIHSTSQQTDSEYKELWHTTLQAKSSLNLQEPNELEEFDPIPNKMFIIWTPDRVNENNWETSLTPTHRKTFLKKSLLDANGAININQFIMSPLGAWIDGDKIWSKAEWIQRSVLGRDIYVKGAIEGICCFSGHKVMSIEITERKHGKSKDKSVFYLHKTYSIHFLERTKLYDQNRRDFVFTKLSLKGSLSYEIDKPRYEDPEDNHFIIEKNKKPILFPFLGVDDTGKEVHFEAPLVLIETGKADSESEVRERIQKGISYYNSPQLLDLRTQDMRGQSINYLKSSNIVNQNQKYSYPTLSMTFRTKWISNPLYEGIHPVLDDPEGAAKVYLPMLDNIVGGDSKANSNLIATHKVIQFYDEYLTSTNGENKGGIFLTLKSPYKHSFTDTNTADKTGGLAAPNLSVYGISSNFGPVNVISDEIDSNTQTIKNALKFFADGNFDPMSYFDLKSKLFGFFTLGDIIIEKKAGDDQIQVKFEDQVPALKTTIDPVSGNVQSTFNWEPSIRKNFDTGFIELILDPNNTEGSDPLEPVKSLMLEVVIVKTRSSGPKVNISGNIKSFSLVFLKLLEVVVENFSFEKSTDKKMKINLDSIDFKFRNELSLLDKLKEKLPAVFDNNAEVEIYKDGLKVNYSFPIPDVQLGAFNLFNISLNSILFLPFGDKPLKFGFGFAKPSNPFMLTVSIYGGGGFFEFISGPKGIESLRAALEFGGHSAMNLGVASGSITVVAGVFLQIEKSQQGQSLFEDKTTVTGYLRASGSLDVLGLITVCADFFMGLTYPNNGDVVYGSATIRVKIKTFMASRSVSLTLTRTFKVKSRSSFDKSQQSILTSDKITFETMMNPTQYKKYRLAFAPIPRRISN